MPRKTSLPFLALPLLLAGCDILGIGRACTLDARPAITVLVLDSLTNEPPEAAGEIIVRDGAYADTVTLSPSQMARGNPSFLAEERRGRYTVEVDVSGYAHWVREDVRVDETDDGCHVDTESLTVLLQRIAE